jgi:hypothetical protein
VSGANGFRPDFSIVKEDIGISPMRYFLVSGEPVAKSGSVMLNENDVRGESFAAVVAKDARRAVRLGGKIADGDVGRVGMPNTAINC